MAALALSVAVAASRLAHGAQGPADGRLAVPSPTGAVARADPPSEQEVLPAVEACRDSGYLCVPVDEAGELRILRWPLDVPTLRIRVPVPEGTTSRRSRALQQAAVRGVLAWQGVPKRLAILDRNRPGPADVEIRWVRRLPGDAVGETRTEAGALGAEVFFRVTSLLLATDGPGPPDRELTAEEVQAAAAHEMGHALGLPHSDRPTDIMYPENTATRVSARDYRTVEALYRLPNLSVIVRAPGR